MHTYKKETGNYSFLKNKKNNNTLKNIIEIPCVDKCVQCFMILR